jgi:hypothetical protein
VVEYEIHAVMLPPLGHAELSRFETKTPSQLQQVTLDVIQMGRLQLFLRVFRAISQADEF